MPAPRINLFSSDAADRWSTMHVRPRVSLRCDARTLRCAAHIGQTPVREWDDPREAIKWMTATWPDPAGRWIGHINYEAGRLFEALPGKAVDDLGLPLLQFTFCSPASDPAPGRDFSYATGDAPPRSNFTREQYEKAVARAVAYIGAGDVFQVNLSQRFSAGLSHDPARLYHQLVRQSPPRYGALLSYGDYAIVSHSPELFFRVDGRRIVTRPMKGTRPATAGMQEELRDSGKDIAELNMIVDLERNDLGRICQVGSIRVTDPRQIESHPGVFQGVATIEGKLREEVTLLDILAAMFPGGSVTGAPKIRAMQIIDELEPVARGPYCGAIGYLASDGAMQFSVAIRTMIVKDGLVHVPVGGGIVADSDPAAEYEETLTKAAVLFDALGIALPG